MDVQVLVCKSNTAILSNISWKERYLSMGTLFKRWYYSNTDCSSQSKTPKQYECIVLLFLNKRQYYQSTFHFKTFLKSKLICQLLQLLMWLRVFLIKTHQLQAKRYQILTQRRSYSHYTRWDHSHPPPK